jgi:hypothetical protein
VKVALALALTDPTSAKQVLDRALTPADRESWHRYQDREKLLALALADPANAKTAVDSAIAGIVRQKSGFVHTGVSALATVLTQPDRLYELVCRHGNFVGEFFED